MTGVLIAAAALSTGGLLVVARLIGRHLRAADRQEESLRLQRLSDPPTHSPGPAVSAAEGPAAPPPVDATTQGADGRSAETSPGL